MSDKEQSDKEQKAKRKYADKLRNSIDSKNYEIGQMADNIRVALMEDDAELVAIFKDELKRLRSAREDMEDKLDHLEPGKGG